MLLVLLIGCVNLASLLLLRGAARSRNERARRSVRGVDGSSASSSPRAPCWRPGGALGLLVGWWGSRLLGALVPPAVSAIQETHLDAATVAFTAGLSIVAGLLFGWSRAADRAPISCPRFARRDAVASHVTRSATVSWWRNSRSR